MISASRRARIARALKGGDHDAAQVHLTRHLVARPGDASARCVLARLQLDADAPTAAAQTLAEAPEPVTGALAQRAFKAATQAGVSAKTPAAGFYAHRLMTLSPSCPDLAFLCARAFTLSGEAAAATAAFESAIAQAPRDNAAWRLRYANHLRQTGAHAAARAQLERAVAVEPNFRNARRALADLDAHEGAFTRAAEGFARLAAADPGDSATERDARLAARLARWPDPPPTPGPPFDTVIFIHIPKTGGSTLRQVLTRGLAANRVRLLTGPETAQLCATTDLSGYRLISGHVPLGMHALIADRPAYVTMLRHPLERIASEYRYRHQRHHAGKGRHGRAAGSFEAFVEALVPYDDNWLTRFLAGTDYMAVGAGDRPYDPLRNAPIDAAVFDRAVGNLEDKLHAFGLCEAFTESVELIHARLGWVPAFYRPINRSEFSATLADLPQSTRDRLAERNSWDLELYARAQKLFWRTYHDVFTERTRTDASAAHERS